MRNNSLNKNFSCCYGLKNLRVRSINFECHKSSAQRALNARPIFFESSKKYFSWYTYDNETFLLPSREISLRKDNIVMTAKFGDGSKKSKFPNKSKTISDSNVE